MLHKTARPYLHVTKVSYAFAKNGCWSLGILVLEAGSHFDAVSTSGIAGPEFKTYRIIMYSAGLFSNPARESKWKTFAVKILRGVRGELGCSSQKLQGEMFTKNAISEFAFSVRTIVTALRTPG